MTRSSNRRDFLRSSASLAAGIALAGPLQAMFARHAEAGSRVPLMPKLGELFPTRDETTGLPLLRLPRGFRYRSFGWTGDVMDDGTLTPDRHDGMAVVHRRGAELTLVRNHERGPSEPGNPLPVVGAGNAPTYDPFLLEGAVSGLGGGTTTISYRGDRFTGAQATLAGTLTNCAGGPTPWGSWLSCEEVTIRGSVIGARDHGYVFEVPAPQLGKASARPIKDMGLMDHEAAAVDPRTGYVYLTEDNGPHSGLYRFRPHDRSGRIDALEAGGKLEMAKVVTQDNADLRAIEQGQYFAIEWVPVAEPDADPEAFSSPGPGFPAIEGSGRSGPYLQGEARGGARFSRLEGCWYHRGVIYFTDTSAGPVGKGVVWALLPDVFGNDHDWLTALFVSPSEQAADNPDNITVAPFGGIVLCEDGGGRRNDAGELIGGTRLIGVDGHGEAFPVAENNVQLDAGIDGKPLIEPGDYRSREFAGATFSPFGQILFVNIQTPGITFAIRGPWRRVL